MNLTKGFYILLVIGILILFFFGPLIIFNPIKLGFESIKHDRARIYINDVSLLHSGYNKVDEYMDDFEQDLGISYAHPIQIIITKNKNDFKRFLPWIDAEKAEVKTMPFGNVIFINSELIVKEGYSQESFLKEELILELIYQNSNFLNATAIDNQMWLSEGLSAYYRGFSYYSDTKFKQVFDESPPVYSEISVNLYTGTNSNDRKFMNTLYKNFVSFIISSYGKDVFKQFLKKYIDGPARFRKIFSDVYGKSMLEVIKEFEMTITH